MTGPHALAVLAAGLAAGTVNTIIGSGSLITFPTLLAIGYPPVLANVSNTVGLAPGSVSGAVGYRRELAGQRARLIRLGLASAVGGVVGGLLLLVLPPSVFRGVVPVLLLIACVLVAVQPRLSTLLPRRPSPASRGGPVLVGLVFLTGVYGGYFGAAQGVLLVALLGLFLADDLQRINAAKNVLAAIVNGVAAILFIASTHVAWAAVGILAVGSIVGGQLGAVIGRRIPGGLLRLAIFVLGVGVAIELLRTG